MSAECLEVKPCQAWPGLKLEVEATLCCLDSSEGKNICSICRRLCVQMLFRQLLYLDKNIMNFAQP